MNLEIGVFIGISTVLFTAGVYVGRDKLRTHVDTLETVVNMQYGEIIRRLELLEDKLDK